MEAHIPLSETPEAVITEKPLSDADRSIIKKQLYITSFIALFAIGIFSAIFYFIGSSFNDNSGFGMIPFFMFGLVGAFFVFIIGYMFSKIFKDLKSGVKKAIEGIVEDKRFDIQTSTSRNSGSSFRGGGSRTRTSTKRSYYITVGGKEYSVSQKMLADVNVGDLVYFEMAEFSSTLLKYQVLDEATDTIVQRSPIQRPIGDYPKSKKREAPLSEKDKDIIKNFFTASLKKRLTTLAIISIPVIGLVYSGLAGLLILLFPIPIIIIYQIVKSVLLYLNYKKSVDSGRKQLVTTHVTDKNFITIKRNGVRSLKHVLRTTYGKVHVNKNLYDLVNSGEEIIVHEAKNLKVVLGISIDEKFYPN